MLQGAFLVEINMETFATDVGLAVTSQRAPAREPIQVRPTYGVARPPGGPLANRLRIGVWHVGPYLDSLCLPP